MTIALRNVVKIPTIKHTIEAESEHDFFIFDEFYIYRRVRDKRRHFRDVTNCYMAAAHSFKYNMTMKIKF